MQILVNQGHLSPLTLKTLTGLAVRRDGTSTGALKARQANLQIDLGVTLADANAPSPWFAANQAPLPQRVFSGVVSIPASPPLTSSTVPWDALHSITIPFDTPFAYASGNLCLEVVGQPIGQTLNCWWPVDAEETGLWGTASNFGFACGVHSPTGSFTAIADASDARIGSTIVLAARGQIGTAGLAFIGDQRWTPPIPLSVIQAPGCFLHINPVATLPATFLPAEPNEPSGLAHALLPVPVNTALLYGVFWTQWVNIESTLPRSLWSNSAGLTTSNGIEVTISPTPPTLGMSSVARGMTVASPLPTFGEIDVAKAPVLGFVWQ